MSRVAEMRGLTEEMARSHEERMAALTSRRADVQNALQETRQRMATCHTEQGQAAAALHQDLAKAAVDLRADTQSTMREIHSARMASASAQRAERRQNHADLSRGTHHLMEETHRRRVTMAADQRVSLGEGRADLAAEMTRFLGETTAARATMSRAQQEELRAGRAALDAGVSTTLAGYRDGRKALADDLAEFGQVWGGFTEVMRARRGSVASDPPAAVGPRPKPDLRAKPPAGAPRAKAEETSPTGAATCEPHRVPPDEAVFGYLADHPDGVRLVELEDHFGTLRIRLAPILNRLIQENKARKDVEHKLYFAT